MEAASTTRGSLGEYFVERGLISQSDLERAHAEQLTTGKRLADILVKRGLVTGRDITEALMDQLGLASAPEAPETPPEHDPDDSLPLADESETAYSQPDLVLVPSEPDTPWPGEVVDAKWPGEVDEIGGDDPPAAETSLSVEPWPVPDAWVVTTEAAPEAVPEVVPEVVPAVVLDVLDDVESQPLEEAPPEDIQAVLEAKHHELAEALTSAATWTGRAAELQGEIDDLLERARAAAAEREAVPVPTDSPDDHDPATLAAVPEAIHLENAESGAVYLVPNADRFDLVELDLLPPAVGEAVEIGDRRYVVTRIGRSPLAFDRRSCAVLEKL